MSYVGLPMWQVSASAVPEGQQIVPGMVGQSWSRWHSRANYQLGDHSVKPLQLKHMCSFVSMHLHAIRAQGSSSSIPPADLGEVLIGGAAYETIILCWAQSRDGVPRFTTLHFAMLRRPRELIFVA